MSSVADSEILKGADAEDNVSERLHLLQMCIMLRVLCRKKRLTEKKLL